MGLIIHYENNSNVLVSNFVVSQPCSVQYNIILNYTSTKKCFFFERTVEDDLSLCKPCEFLTKGENVPTSGYENYINPGYGLSLVDTLWNASSYRQPLEQESNPMT